MRELKSLEKCMFLVAKSKNMLECLYTESEGLLMKRNKKLVLSSVCHVQHTVPEEGASRESASVS